MVPDPSSRHADLTYFIFFSIFSATAVDIHAPSSFLSLEFSLRLAQLLCTSVAHFIDITPTTVSPTTSPKPMEDLNYELDFFSNDILFKIEADDMWFFLIEARNTPISTATVTPSAFVQPSIYFFTLSIFPRQL